MSTWGLIVIDSELTFKSLYNKDELLNLELQCLNKNILVAVLTKYTRL